MTPRTFKRKQRGVALIMAVLIVALATILAVNVASEGYMDQRRTGNMLVMDQAFQVALGGEALAAEALANDLQNSKVDTPDETWAMPVNLPVEDYGEIQGKLEDMQGRFNLNNLLNTDGSRNQFAVQQFKRLLELLQIDVKWATIAVDWLDADNNPEFPDGAEDTVYTAQMPAYLAANMPVLRASALLAMVDASGQPFGLENYRKLEPYVTALPIGTSLNVCTAAGVVLDSLSSTLSQFNGGKTTESRKNTCFPSMKDVDTAFNSDKTYTDFRKAAPNGLSESTSYFQGNIVVSIGTAEFALYSVLYRSGGQGSAKVQSILRSFGTP